MLAGGLSTVRPAPLWLFNDFGAIYKYSDLLTYQLYQCLGFYNLQRFCLFQLLLGNSLKNFCVLQIQIFN